MTSTFIHCSCGFISECDSQDEIFRHDDMTVFVKNCFSNGCDWFITHFDGHDIRFNMEN